MQSAAFYTPRRRKISLTALIDVVFILLMFFMLSSSFSKWQAIDLESPIANNSSIESDALFLLINNDHSITMSDESISLSNIRLFSKEHANRIGDKSIVIVPEENVNVQALITTFDQLKASGLTKVTLGDSRRTSNTSK